MTTEDDPDPRRFAGVSVPEPDYAGDDGTADPQVSDAMAAYDDGRCARRDVVVALLTARLMTPLVAVLDEVEESPDGLRREKSSHMASVSLVGADGRRALLAFTSVAAMTVWDPAARGIPAPATRVAAAALEEGADALLLDLAGPARLVLEGAALQALALGEVPAAPWNDPDVAAAVLAAAGQVAGLGRVRLVAPERPDDPGSPDLVLLLELTPGADPDAVAEQVARTVVGDPVVADSCPRGVGVGVVGGRGT